MVGRNRRRPPPENARASYLSKRRTPYFSGSLVKRSRLAFKPETLTGNPNPSRSSHSSNRFESFRFSSRARRKKRSEESRSAVCSRRWVFSSRDCSNCTDKVVVVTYNILGVENASKHLDLYSNIPHSFLEWDRRKRLILEEIKNYNAGILCFQEVDHFNDLDELFKNDGFKGVFKARTGEAHDGCAIFWKDELFTLLHQEDIEFQRFGLRNNVAQLCVLEVNHDKSESDTRALTAVTPAARNKRFVMGNIHVLFNPNRGDIKLGQLDIQLHNRRNMSGQLEIQSNCGVFRSQIGDEASIPMSVSRQLLYRWSMEELRLATGAGVTLLEHHLKLCSAYSSVPGNHRTRDDIGEPLATSYHSKFMGTVDYIWHTEELIPVRVLETLPIDILRRTRGLPNEKWGSDHLALVCELAFANNGNVS